VKKDELWGGGGGTYTVLVENFKRPLGGSGGTWEDNIKAQLTEIEWEGVDWFMSLRTWTPGSCCGHGNEPSVSIKCRHFINYL
jgi:hypothetical protein